MSRIESIKAGDSLPGREFSCDNVQLFLYNAALWNAHRIHYDHDYATDVEGYSGLVIAGPLMGDWLTQCVLAWLDDEGSLTSFEYSNRKAAYVDDVLRFTGEVAAVDPASGEIALNLSIRNAAGEDVTPGSAVVRYPPA